MSAIVTGGGGATYRKTVSCPIHDTDPCDRPVGHYLGFARSRSTDLGYPRVDTFGKRGLLMRERSAENRSFRGKNPFQHSHSVTCATSSSADPLQGSELKAKSVGSLSTPQRPPRPTHLDLCPNQNASFNSYRRRYSRSSERSLDFDDYYLQEFGTSFSNFRSSRRRSSSRDSGRPSFAEFPGRYEEGSHGRWANLRKGFSLLSLCAGNDDFDDEEEEEARRCQSSRILRPPTRHFYHRGISGLPVKCPAKYMGLAY